MAERTLTRLPVMQVVLAVVVGATFFAAAASKALEPNAFVSVIRRVSPVDLGYREALGAAVAIVSIEAALAAGLLMGSTRRGSAGLAMVVLVVFSAMLVRMAMMPRMPSCGCFGTPRGDGSRGEAILGLVRNLALIGMCVSVRGGASRAKVARRATLPTRARAGFTLIELLVCIAIVAVIVSVALPALGSAREAAKRDKTLSTMRQLSASVGLYANDFADRLPCIVPAGTPYTEVMVNGVKVRGAYFVVQRRAWINLIFPVYFHGPREVLERPEVREATARTDPDEADRVVLGDAMLTFAASATATYWMNDGQGRPLDLGFSNLRGMGLGDVVHPSGKGLLILGLGHGVADERDRSWVARADGACGVHRSDELPREMWLVRRPWGASPQPVMTTREGMRGVDF